MGSKKSVKQSPAKPKAKAVANAAASKPATDLSRPYADSPAPDHCKVDLCTAQAEWMRTLYPEAPQPVFSTLALMNGAAARGAQRLRPGFSFSPSMDAAWAVGFPRMAFIVDGIPVPDTIAATLDFYRVTEKRALGHSINRWGRAQVEHGRIYSRRAALARVFELSPYPEDLSPEGQRGHASSIFDLDPAAAEMATASSEVSDFHLRTAIIGSHQRFQALSEDIPLLVALLGPARIADMLMRIAESDPTTIRPSSLFFALAQVALLLTAEQESELSERTRAWFKANQTTKEADEARYLFDGLAKAEERRRSEKKYGFDRTLIFGLPLDKVRAEILKGPTLDWNDVFFVDPNEALRLFKKGKSYEQRDIELAYVRSFSSIATEEVIPAMLQAGAEESRRAMVEAWFEARAAWAAPHLDHLAGGKDAQLAELATREAKRLAKMK